MNDKYPDVRLYIEPNSGYWLFIEREHWKIMDKLIHGVDKETLMKNYGNLFNILSTSRFLNDSADVYLNVLKDKFGLLILHFADGCNLSCKYCFVNAPSGRHNIMDISIAIKAIENMVNTSDNFSIEFNAGEPFLYTGFIEKVIEYVKKHYTGENIRFYVQTNGTLITRKIVNFIKKYEIKVGVSIDGPAEVHDKFRIFPNGQGSFVHVVKGINILKDNKVPFGVLSVITDPDDLRKSFDFFVKKDIRYVKFNILFQRTRTENSNTSRINQLKLAKAHCEIFREALNLYRNGKYIFLSNVIAMLKNIILPEKTYMCMKSPCGAARNQISIDWKGFIYPCHRFVGVKEFSMGHVKDYNDYKNLYLGSQQLRDLLNRNVDRIDKCKKCPFKNFCGGGCAAAVWAKTQDLYRESDTCEYYKYMFECLFWEIYKNRNIILNYINHQNQKEAK